MLFSSLTIPPAEKINAVAGSTLSAVGWREEVPIVYGEVQLGALILNVLPSASANFYLVQCLWGVAGGGISNAKLNGLDFPAGTTATHYDGTQVAVDTALLAAFAAQGITYADTLYGYAYSVFSIPISTFDGRLSITALVKGRKVYDPRFDQVVSAKDVSAAVAGSPGTMPNGWAAWVAGGISSQVIGTGTEEGLPYVDVRFYGTAIPIASFGVSLIDRPVAAPAETWKAAIYARVVAGSAGNVDETYIRLDAYDAGYAFLSSEWTPQTATTAPLRSQRLVSAARVMPASTGRAGFYFIMYVNSVKTIDVTLRFAFPTFWKTTDTADPIAWADNPALADADFLFDAKHGCGEKVDWASVSTTATANDQMVSGVEKRRRLNLALTQQAPVTSIAETLRAYAGCWHVPGANGLKLVPDADAASVATYDHSAGTIEAIAPLVLRDAGSSPTAVEVIYTNTSTVPWQSASMVVALAGAGDTLPWRLSVVNLPGITRATQARREATERLNKLTLTQVTTTVDVFDLGIKHEVGDIVTVTHPIGLSAYTMRVTGVDMVARGRWRLGLAQHSAAAYSDSLVGASSLAVTSPLVNTGPPADVAGLSASATQGGALIKWTPLVDPRYAFTELRLGTSWSAGTPLSGGSIGSGTQVAGSEFPWLSPAQGSYTLRAKHFDTRGIPSTNETIIAVTIGTGSLVSWTSVNGRPMFFRAASRGNSDTQAPFAGESWYSGALVNAETGAVIQQTSNMYSVVKINRSTGACTFLGHFDTLNGGTTAANAMASALNGIDVNHIAVVTTWDEPQINRGNGNLPAAMYRCGASRAVFGSPQFKFRAAYILVGIGGCGEGNGYEAYSGSVDSDTNAWCDVAFYLQNGNLVISGSSATPRTLADYGAGGLAYLSTIGTGQVDANAITSVAAASDAGPIALTNSYAEIKRVSFGPYSVAVTVTVQMVCDGALTIIMGPTAPYTQHYLEDNYGNDSQVSRLNFYGGNNQTQTLAAAYSFDLAASTSGYVRLMARFNDDGGSDIDIKNLNLVASILKR